jgi:hypothetical protein
MLQRSPQLITHSQPAVETLFSKWRIVLALPETLGFTVNTGQCLLLASVLLTDTCSSVLLVITEEWIEPSVRFMTHCRLNQVCVTCKGSVSTSQRTLYTVLGKGSATILKLTSQVWHNLVHELCPLLHVKCNNRKMKNICIAMCNMRQWTPRISGTPLSESYTIVLQHQDGPGIYSLFRPYF